MSKHPATIVLNRQFPGREQPFVTVTHDRGRSLLTVVTRDLKGVGKKEFKRCLDVVGRYIRDVLANDQSTIMVVDMREAANFDIFKHLGVVTKFEKEYREHNALSLSYTLMVSAGPLMTMVCTTLRSIGKSGRPLYVVEHNPQEDEKSTIPWESDDAVHPPHVDPKTFAQ
jgi:hypothetical protein